MQSPTLFPTGRPMATPGAIEALGGTQSNWREAAAVILTRHQSGDWGGVCDEDRQANEEALARGARLLSVYTVGGFRLYVITEADRSATTILRPDEY